jgi:hypothetical protein
MFTYIKQLIDKQNPASTAAFLTIVTVLVLLFCVAGVLVASLWKPIPGALVALLGTVGSLTGIHAIKEAFESKKPPENEG